MEFFIEIKPISIVLHGIAAATGLGAVVVTDTLFFKFLKDFRISATEDQILRTLSKIVWVAIICLVITGLALFLSNPNGYSTNPKFILKMIILGVIILNGIFLNIVITPRIKEIIFGPTRIQSSIALRILRHLAFAGGVLSIVSWIIVFILGSIRSIHYELPQALLGYGVVCAGAILGSQLYALWFRYHK